MQNTPVIVRQPVPSCRCDLQYHLFPGDDSLHPKTARLYEFVNPHRDHLRTVFGASLLWCADTQEQSTEFLYIDDHHCSAACSDQLAGEIIAQAVAAGLLAELLQQKNRNDPLRQFRPMTCSAFATVSSAHTRSETSTAAQTPRGRFRPAHFTVSLPAMFISPDSSELLFAPCCRLAEEFVSPESARYRESGTYRWSVPADRRGRGREIDPY